MDDMQAEPAAGGSSRQAVGFTGAGESAWSTVSATIAAGDVIRIIPDRGPERLMVVAHVERHIITLADVPGAAAGEGQS